MWIKNLLKLIIVGFNFNVNFIYKKNSLKFFCFDHNPNKNVFFLLLKLIIMGFNFKVNFILKKIFFLKWFCFYHNPTNDNNNFFF